MPLRYFAIVLPFKFKGINATLKIGDLLMDISNLRVSGSHAASTTVAPCAQEA